MPWQADSPYVRQCGLCSLSIQWHTLVRHPSGWVAMCSTTQMSDVQDQDLLETVAEGR